VYLDTKQGIILLTIMVSVHSYTYC